MKLTSFLFFISFIPFLIVGVKSDKIKQTNTLFDNKNIKEIPTCPTSYSVRVTVTSTTCGTPFEVEVYGEYYQSYGTITNVGGSITRTVPEGTALYFAATAQNPGNINLSVNYRGKSFPQMLSGTDPYWIDEDNTEIYCPDH